MFWNNLGCIHFAMSKHNLGIFYFKKALQENDNVCAQLSAGNTDPGKLALGTGSVLLDTHGERTSIGEGIWGWGRHSGLGG